ncbi:Uncharacterized protein dnm_073610 [Desulfonema magnum]|uniref:Uncharacterized protein n=1 Tax=Desulfonema magnum TaxID=45655 RepID=A0A975BU07_9BACT|nr:Uncharacterized protein dnm_073610 [Desulfonema magnum]
MIIRQISINMSQMRYFFTVEIHFENPGFLSENIVMTGGEKPGLFISVYF